MKIRMIAALFAIALTVFASGCFNKCRSCSTTAASPCCPPTSTRLYPTRPITVQPAPVPAFSGVPH